MSDFISDPSSVAIQRVDSDESIYDIRLGNTVGERDWAWENICFEKQLLERQLRTTIDEFQHLQFEREDLQTRLVENERKLREVQSYLEKQMENTRRMISRLSEEKAKTRRLEEELGNLKSVERDVNDIRNRNYELEQSINALNVIVQDYTRKYADETAKTKFLEQMYDMKESALEKAKEQNRKLQNKLSILMGTYTDSVDKNLNEEEQIDNKRFKRKLIQECRYCHKALEPGQTNGNCAYHPRKPIHLPGHDDPKMMVWQCCHQYGKNEPTGCQHQNCHEPL